MPRAPLSGQFLLTYTHTNQRSNQFLLRVSYPRNSVVEPLDDDAPVTEWMARRAFLMGQAAGAIEDVLPAKTIVENMVSVAVEHIKVVNRMVCRL